MSQSKNNTLHITNGDAAIPVIRATGAVGNILPWRDLLHLGPIADTADLRSQSKQRAQFIAACGWANVADVEQDFRRRDEMLLRAHEFDEVVLWFEHDLYDQLQLVQILAVLASVVSDKTSIKLINTDEYLGTISANRLGQWAKKTVTISADHLVFMQRVWRAITASSPELLAVLVNEDMSPFDHLQPAILRLLAEFPEPNCGLSKSQFLTLKLLSEAPEKSLTAGRLYGAYQQLDTPRFMADMPYWWLLRQWANAPNACVSIQPNSAEQIAFSQREITITQHGQDILSGVNQWRIVDENQYWVGGTLIRPDKIWFWNAKTRQLTNA